MPRCIYLKKYNCTTAPPSKLCVHKGNQYNILCKVSWVLNFYTIIPQNRYRVRISKITYNTAE